VHNRLEADEDGRVRAVATEEREVVPCGIVFRSVGYRGVGIPGVPFDDRAERCRTRAAAFSAPTVVPIPVSIAPAGSSVARQA
jgi:ferredoxin--NADP+ reductase